MDFPYLPFNASSYVQIMFILNYRHYFVSEILFFLFVFLYPLYFVSLPRESRILDDTHNVFNMKSSRVLRVVYFRVVIIIFSYIQEHVTSCIKVSLCFISTKPKKVL